MCTNVYTYQCVPDRWSKGHQAQQPREAVEFASPLENWAAS